MRIYGNSSIQYESNNAKYVTTFDVKSNDYVVYNTDELFNVANAETISESQKVNQNADLVKYYTDLSISKNGTNNFGIIIFVSTLLLICIIVTVMYTVAEKK